MRSAGAKTIVAGKAKTMCSENRWGYPGQVDAPVLEEPTLNGTADMTDVGMNDMVQQAAWVLHDALSGTGITVATAESLTGGAVGGAICAVAGASEYYVGGVISYANTVKVSVLGVSQAVLAERGSVDALVARQMAAGAARVCGADCGVSTTGVAGPEPHDGKPVGTVFIGVHTPTGAAVHEFHYAGCRGQIRAQACADALELLAQAVRG